VPVEANQAKVKTRWKLILNNGIKLKELRQHNNDIIIYTTANYVTRHSNDLLDAT